MQGWTVDPVSDQITFLEPPANGVAISVKEFGTAGYNATDLWAFSAWNPGWGYPGEVEFFSDRLVWARNLAQPQTLWMTQAASYKNFGRHTPGLDSDGITLTFNARQVNAIRELIPMKNLIIMTTSAEVLLTTGADEVVAPGKVGFAVQSFYGSGKLAAQVVGQTALFVQSRGAIARDLGFQFTEDGYTGNDLTVYASHLLEGFTIVDWAYQQVPYSALWIVRSDGALLSLTYLREQEVVGWALHTTQGKYVTVATIPQGDQNAVYVGVERVVRGETCRYVERLAERKTADVREGFFVDSGLTYDGRNRPGAITLTGGTNWDETEILVLGTALDSWVGASDVGDQVKLHGYDGETVCLQIVEYLTATTVNVQAIGSVPESLRFSPAVSWDIMRDTVSGLDHLEDQTVAILSDGGVHGQRLVTDGTVALDYPAAVVHVGLPYQSLIESLDVNVAGAETVRDRPKLINKVSLIVKDTRGLKAGPDEQHLDEFKTELEADGPIQAYTGLFEVGVVSSYDKNGVFVVVQDDPIPATVLGLIPHWTVGG